MQMNGQNGKRRRLNSEINVTPFVDVMLVLLVIFMVTAPMLVAGVEVDLPQTSAAPMSAQDEPLVIDIDRNGDFYIQGNIIPKESLTEKLAAIADVKADSRILVRGDRSLPYGDIMKAFAAIKNAGYQHVALVTEVEN